MVSAYFCERADKDLLIIEEFEGKIILFYNKSKGILEKPSKEEYQKLKEELDNMSCKIIYSRNEKELNFKFERVEYIKFERRHYTIYSLSYRNDNAYLLEFYDAAGGDFEFFIFKNLMDALEKIYRIEKKFDPEPESDFES